MLIIIIERPSFHVLPAGLGLQKKKYLKSVFVLCIVAICFVLLKGRIVL